MPGSKSDFMISISQDPDFDEDENEGHEEGQEKEKRQRKRKIMHRIAPYKGSPNLGDLV